MRNTHFSKKDWGIGNFLSPITGYDLKMSTENWLKTKNRTVARSQKPKIGLRNMPKERHTPKRKYSILTSFSVEMYIIHIHKIRIYMRLIDVVSLWWHCPNFFTMLWQKLETSFYESQFKSVCLQFSPERTFLHAIHWSIS